MKENLKIQNFSGTFLFFVFLAFVFFVEKTAVGQKEDFYMQGHVKQERGAGTEEEAFSKEIQKNKLRIVVFQDPPFSFQKEDGTWQGIAVDIIKKIALDNNLEYEFIPIFKREQLLFLEEQQKDGFSQYDIILWSIPDVILKSEYAYEYSLPYYIGGVAMVQKKEPTTFLGMGMQALSSNVFITSFSLLCFYLAMGTGLMWLFERKEKGACFRKDVKGGIWDAFWWCTSVTSTIFPCNLIPKSVMGKWLAIIWMYLSVTLFLGVLGTISSSLTVSKMKTPIQELKDLSSFKIGVVQGSSTEIFLKDNMISYRTVRNIEEGLQEVQTGEKDTFIGPEPLVRYYLKNNKEYDNLMINPISFSMEYYSFIVPLDSGLRHSLNYELLRLINTFFWKKVLFEYLGHIPSIH